ncbi:MAG: AAA family ATPase [Pseudomonadota bacterium]
MYERHYGFSARPFQLLPDPEFYFESESQRKALVHLRYGLDQGEGFMVVTGEAGAGKSTLVAHLIAALDPDVFTVGQIVTSALDGEELVHVAAHSFGLKVEGRDKVGALGAIESFLQSEARAGRRCLLVVDECQKLGVNALEELSMLSNFQLGSRPLLQGMLLGQPEFRTTIADHPGLDQLRQRIIASDHLETLSEQEVEAYISHRLEHVGWDGNPAVGSATVAAIYDATGGNPRQVNQIMNRMLLLGAIEDKSELTPAMVAAVREEMFESAATVANPESATSASAPTLPSESPSEDELAPSEDVAALLAEREAQTSQIKAAIDELKSAGTESQPLQMDDKVRDAINRIETRLEEQEQSFRHVVGMLIEWLEEDTSREAA